jgi:hypothetical protein
MDLMMCEARGCPPLVKEGNQPLLRDFSVHNLGDVPASAYPPVVVCNVNTPAALPQEGARLR